MNLFDDAFQAQVTLPKSKDSRKLEIHYLGSGVYGENELVAQNFYQNIKEELLKLYEELNRQLLHLDQCQLSGNYANYYKDYIFKFDENLKTYLQSSSSRHIEGLIKSLEILVQMIHLEDQKFSIKLSIFDDLDSFINELLKRCEIYSEQERELEIYKSK